LEAVWLPNREITEEIMMTDEVSQFVPVRKDLLFRNLSDEMILYDKTTHRAHCLNRTAAAVWNLCDGNNSVAEIARRLGLESAKDVIWAALRQLNKSGLLQNQIPPSITSDTLSRRELVKKMGVCTAMAIPVARSILVPKSSAAVSPLRTRQGRSSRHRSST
jgi:coenzyme PQQ synthesis protein D (PqqD)